MYLCSRINVEVTLKFTVNLIDYIYLNTFVRVRNTVQTKKANIIAAKKFL